MDEIALHIDFLLHTNDCIIVPGLGGFVVNTTHIERNGLWGIDSPTCELIFNNKLTYNDGLLAESLMRTNDISFERANKKIETACESLKEILQKQEEVVWSNLGAFRLNDENEPFFLPNKSYVRPCFFGLTNSRLKPASLLTTKDNDNENAIPIRILTRYATRGIAVALLFFFMVVSYNNFGPKNQQADMVSRSLIFSNEKANTQSFATNKISNASKSYANSAVKENNNMSSATTNKNTLNLPVSKKSYYIIVGVYEVSEVANQILANLKKQGFSEASILKRPGRLDVYSASFTYESEAQSFLKEVHKKYPAYKDAWLLNY